MPTGIRITPELKQKVVNCYKREPMTIADCSREMGLSCPVIINILNEYNIKRYSKTRIFSPQLNERYFQFIDSEAKAYYLGLLITDGNIFIDTSPAHRQASISITQNEADKWMLERFLQEVQSNTSVGYDGRGACQAAIKSDLMAKDLKQYGVIPNKTLLAYLPKIDDMYMSHLIRGILDGDGNITSTYTSLGKHKHAISFCGSHKLMCDIKEYICSNIGCSNVSVYDYNDRHLSEVKWQSINDMYCIGEWIYNDANIYFVRKHSAYLDFKSKYNL